ncbi:AAA family ATPase, partial [bacterium]|nr:AAA family ATPase [bacterium]
DTSFFYQINQHAQAFLKMQLSIENNISVGMIHGQSGMGKTLVSQIILLNLDIEKYQPVLILVSPGMSKTSFLRELCLELSLVKGDDKVSPSSLLRLLHDYIIELNSEGKRLVIIVDEAHFLSSDCLHIVRTISNIELPEKKLTTCVLIGENSLWNRIQRDTYSSLRSRIYQRVELKPLSEESTAEYIKFRMLVAGGSPEVFANNVYPIIHKASKGICRNINKVCYNLLLEAYLNKSKVIDKKFAQLVVDNNDV